MTTNATRTSDQIPMECPASGVRVAIELDAYRGGTHGPATRVGRCAACGQPTGYWAKDRLTGLPDRWGWDDLAPAILAHALQRRKTVALLMIDIDHFKQVNDEFGHMAGDLVLQAVSSVLRETTRGTDLISRYGGDEFLVLLPDATSAGASTVARRIREATKAITISAPTTSGAGCVPITGQTVSIGIAVTHSLSDDNADLLQQLLLGADTALRAVKRNARETRIAAGDQQQAPAGCPPAVALEEISISRPESK